MKLISIMTLYTFYSKVGDIQFLKTMPNMEGKILLKIKKKIEIVIYNTVSTLRKFK